MINWFAKLPFFGKVGLFFLGLILLIFFLAIFYFGLRRLVGWQTLKNIKDYKDQITLKDRISLKIEIIKTVASILGGMFFILTIVVAFLNYRVTQEKHTTDLYTQAIEQLGSKKLEVKLGGIYALERIARDSEKDHWPIMEVLTAYVRVHAPYPPKNRSESRKKLPWVKIRDIEDLFQKNQKEKEETKAIIQPDPDIQAILTVLGRRQRSYEKSEDRRLDLRATDLRGADLRKAHMERANLWKAHMEGSVPAWAHLNEAVLNYAHLEGAWLIGTDMKKADLRNANLKKAQLLSAHLEGASLIGTDMQKADLQNANLEGARLINANLEGATLKNTHLKGANLTQAKLERTSLREANLEGAILVSACLKKANFEKARLNGADLQFANFQGVENIDKDQITMAACWPLAFFDDSLLEALGLPPKHNEYLGNKDLSGYNLAKADLRRADLQGFNLKKVNLKGAHLEQAVLWGAHLEGANMRGAKGLTEEQIRSAYYDEKTKLPDYLKHLEKSAASKPNKE
jgi:uncharacterized protein YjbI with pentapeptide repeats